MSNGAAVDDLVPFASVPSGSFVEMDGRVWRVASRNTWNQVTLVPYERSEDLDAVKVNCTGMIRLVRYPASWS